MQLVDVSSDGSIVEENIGRYMRWWVNAERCFVEVWASPNPIGPMEKPTPLLILTPTIFLVFFGLTTLPVLGGPLVKPFGYLKCHHVLYHGKGGRI